eukprot:COSAG01_NODE_10697_length_2102_cov_2.668997_3_plen_262_part_00
MEGKRGRVIGGASENQPTKRVRRISQGELLSNGATSSLKLSMPLVKLLIARILKEPKLKSVWDLNKKIYQHTPHGIFEEKIEQEVSSLQAAANKGDGDAMWGLGNYFYYRIFEREEGDVVIGGEVKFNYCAPRCIKWYEEGAENGHEQSKFDCALMYSTGELIEPNFNKANKWMHDAARTLDDAQMELGECYELGGGVKKNYAKAIILYKKARDSGHDEAGDAIENLLKEDPNLAKFLVEDQEAIEELLKEYPELADFLSN